MEGQGRAGKDGGRAGKEQGEGGEGREKNKGKGEQISVG